MPLVSSVAAAATSVTVGAHRALLGCNSRLFWFLLATIKTDKNGQGDG